MWEQQETSLPRWYNGISKAQNTEQSLRDSSTGAVTRGTLAAIQLAAPIGFDMFRYYYENFIEWRCKRRLLARDYR